MMLALLLARKGVPVTLLEAHKDFDREFRGDTIHPSVLEILDDIGLAEPLHKLRHVKVFGPTLRAANTNFNPFDFRRLKTKFPYIMLIPQTKFLEFIVGEASKYPEFRLKMSANVEFLIEENGSVRGVRYRSPDGWHQVRARLTVGADGRFSKVRHLAGFEPIKTSPPMDILWFRLPHLPEDPQEDAGRVRGGFANGRMLAIFPSGRHPIRESAILGWYILRNWFLPGRKSMVPYRIQWLMRLKPAWFRHDLLTLFDLLQQKKIKPLIAQRLPAARTRITGKRRCDRKIVLMPNG